MKTTTVPRPNVTVEEVTAVLQAALGDRYKIKPSVTSHVHHESSGHANSILVKRNWMEQANVDVVSSADATEIRVGGAANFTLTGILINRASIVRKVHHVLESASELAQKPAY